MIVGVDLGGMGSFRTPASIRSGRRRLGAAVPADARDRVWLALALCPGVVAVAVYLATNPYPAHGAGLYTKIATEIVANGYAPPARIPGYTAAGVPFAYPPLQFYVFATLLDLGADPLAVARLLPGVAVVAFLIPIYLLGRDLAGSRPAGTAAAAMVALNPQILEWHVTAGGVVRAFGFLYATVAVYAGYRAFAARGRGTGSPWRTVAVAGVAFGLTLLTHPVYSLFVVVTLVTFWAVADRSPRGLGRGLAVGLGGTLLAAPWLWWVVATHGPGVFAAASGTHGGVGGGSGALVGDLSFGLEVVVIVAVYLLYRRAVLLPAWLVVAELLFKQPRFAYLVGALVVPAAAVIFVRTRAVGSGTVGSEAGDLDPDSNAHGPNLADPNAGASIPRLGGVDRRAAAAAVVIVLGTIVGGGYFAYEATLASDPSTPEYIDSDSVAAMEWAAAETDPGATFVILGDAAEWFPALTDRTILVGHWGVEWEAPAAFERQEAAYEAVSRCDTVDCVERETARVGDDAPAYVYVPKGQYTIRGEAFAQSGGVERAFGRADGWERAYENDGVVIYESTGGSTG